MRKTIKDLASIIAKTLPIQEPIYEFGSLQVSGQEGFADLRILFLGKKYIGADMRPGAGVDLILDLHSIELASETAGTVLCLDTLEHVEYPHRALEEIHRILKPNGITVISSVMYFPIHDHPYDYWRFTPEAFRSLLKPFQNSFIGYAGKEDFPHTVIGVGFKGEAPGLEEFTLLVEAWKVQQDKQEARELRHLIRQVTPPILYPVLSNLYKIVPKRKKLYS